MANNPYQRNINPNAGLGALAARLVGNAQDSFTESTTGIKNFAKTKFDRSVDELTDKALNDILKRDSLDSLDQSNKVDVLSELSPFVNRDTIANAFDKQQSDVFGNVADTIGTQIGLTTDPDNLAGLTQQVGNLAGKGDTSSLIQALNTRGTQLESKRIKDLGVKYGTRMNELANTAFTGDVSLDEGKSNLRQELANQGMNDPVMIDALVNQYADAYSGDKSEFDKLIAPQAKGFSSQIEGMQGLADKTIGDITGSKAWDTPLDLKDNKEQQDLFMGALDAMGTDESQENLVDIYNHLSKNLPSGATLGDIINVISSTPKDGLMSWLTTDKSQIEEGIKAIQGESALLRTLKNSGLSGQVIRAKSAYDTRLAEIQDEYNTTELMMRGIKDKKSPAWLELKKKLGSLQKQVPSFTEFSKKEGFNIFDQEDGGKSLIDTQNKYKNRLGEQLNTTNTARMLSGILGNKVPPVDQELARFLNLPK